MINFTQWVIPRWRKTPKWRIRWRYLSTTTRTHLDSTPRILSCRYSCCHHDTCSLCSNYQAAPCRALPANNRAPKLHNIDAATLTYKHSLSSLTLCWILSRWLCSAVSKWSFNRISILLSSWPLLLRRAKKTDTPKAIWQTTTKPSRPKYWSGVTRKNSRGISNDFQEERTLQLGRHASKHGDGNDENPERDEAAAHRETSYFDHIRFFVQNEDAQHEHDDAADLEKSTWSGGWVGKGIPWRRRWRRRGSFVPF